MRNMIPRVQLTRNKVARLVVWLLFATVLVGGALLADSNLGRAEQTLVTPSAAMLGPIPASADLSFLDGPVSSNSDASLTKSSTELAALREISTSSSLLAAPEGAGGGSFVSNSSISYLPAWRWDNFILEVSSDGGFLNSMGTLRAIGSSIGSITFALAGVVWMCLLGLLKFGLSIDFLSQSGVAETINSGITALSTKFWYVMGAFWAFVMLKAARLFMKGDVKKAISSMLLFTFAFGAMFAIGNLSEGKTALHANYTLPALTSKVISSLDVAAASLGSGFGIAGQDNGGFDMGGDQGATDDMLTCQRYVDNLYANYDTANGAASVKHPATLKVASKMWQTTFANSWTVAQFGMPQGAVDLPNRTACRQLELQNEIDPKVQADLQAQTAGWGGTGNMEPVAFGPYDTKAGENHRAMTGWAACEWRSGSSWGVTAPFEGQVVGRNAEKDQITPAKCADEFSKKAYDKDTKFNVYYQWGHTMLADDDLHKSSRAWNEAFYGGNTGDRITQGVLALIVSIVFFFSLGFISLGMVAAQFMLILLLVLFPVTLVFIGLGNANGIRMLKLTGTTAASKFLFALLLAFLTEVISLGQTIITGASAGVGIFGQLLYGIMPIIALLVVRKVLSGVGMGDILKPSGALSFMAASSMAATRDASLMKSVSSANAQGGFAAMGARKAKAGAKSTSKAASKAAGVAGGIGKRKDGTHVLDKWGSKKQRASAKERKSDKAKMREAKYGSSGALAGAKYGIKRTSDYTKTLKIQGSGSLIRGAGSALGNSSALKKLGTGAAGLSGAGLASTLGGAGLAAAGLSPLLLGAGVGALALGGGALALRGVRRLGDKNSVKPENFEVKADTYASNIEGVAKRSDAEHRQMQRATGAEKGVVQRNYTDAVLTGRRQSNFGPEFTGFPSAAMHAGAEISYAETMGLGRSDVIVSALGHALPRPQSLSDTNARRNMTIESLSHGAHWLDKATRERGAGESDEEYAARITVAMADRGLLTSDGRVVNVLEKLGMDMNNESDKAEVEEWIKGKKNAKLDGVQFASADSATAARLALKSKIWVENQESDAVAMREEQGRQLHLAIKEAASNLSGLTEFKVNTETSVKNANANYRTAIQAHQATSDPAAKQKTLAALEEARKAWDSATTKNITEMAKRADSSAMVSLDLKAPLVTDVKVLIEEAENSTAELQKMVHQFDVLQSRAFMGDLEALKSLESYTTNTLEGLVRGKTQIEADVERNQKLFESALEKAAQDKSRHGNLKTIRKGSDIVKAMNNSFPRG